MKVRRIINKYGSKNRKCVKCFLDLTDENAWIEKDGVFYSSCRSCHRKRVRRGRELLKYEILKHYSKSSKPKCVFCGFDDIRALCIDHVTNNGSSDRMKMMGKNYGGGGSRFYMKIRKAGYPSGYQTLCANCNLIKEIKKRKIKKIKSRIK